MAGKSTEENFTDEILKSHNKYRAKHRSPNLKISDKVCSVCGPKLNKIAQEWAEKLAETDKAQHRPDNPHGENIYMASNTDPNWKLKGETVVKSWYDEIKFYKFGETSPKNTSEVGHFTQLVWKDSTELGIGEAKSKAGRVYVVCNYDPPGNVIPEFGKNVLPIANPSKIENGDGQFVDENYRDDGNIVLTPSQEELGIRIVQPNLKIVESMERLYAVPSEKIRVWSVWLTKVQEKAGEWNFWLRSHINLILRMSEKLQRAEKEIEKDEPTRAMRSRGGEQFQKDDEKEARKASLPADPRLGTEKPLRDGRESRHRESETSQEMERESILAMEEETIVAEEVAISEVEATASVEEMAEASTRLENETSQEPNDEDTNENVGDGETEVAADEEGIKGEAMEESKKIAWPIGVLWEPVVRVVKEEAAATEKKDEEVEIQEIEIPEDEEDMRNLINGVKEQATIFRSLYKHWREVGDQAVKGIVNRTVMDSEVVPTHEDIPYFFYVNAEPDVEVEHDGETILLPDPTRETITSNFESLHFNLADKPGRG